MKKFITTSTYEVTNRVSISKLLTYKTFYDQHHYYFVVKEDEDPILIRDSMMWLQSQNGNKKVWVLRYINETSEFVE